MTPITNDHELRAALDHLSPTTCRRLASRFAAAVLALSDDPRVRQAVEVAAQAEIGAPLLATAHHEAKAAAAESFTQCGHDTEWRSQAGHFVAAAAAAATAPPEVAAEMGNPAWRAALYARMARTCEMIAEDRGDTHSEAAGQYHLAEAAMGERR